MALQLNLLFDLVPIGRGSGRVVDARSGSVARRPQGRADLVAAVGFKQVVREPMGTVQ